ncbi:MAG: shikimate dehydrogenase, partial [Armatimonadia bacterium]|nr:shikimate dehydrogenase [Armatimonadia bacterium]
MPEKFGFVMHPLNLGDLAKKFPILAKLPDAASRLALKLWGVSKISDIRGIRSDTGAEVEGVF